MKRAILTASLVLAFFVFGTTSVSIAQPRVTGVSVQQPSTPCAKTFTVPMATRAARAVYAGTRHVRLREVRMLNRIERCLRNSSRRGYVLRYYHNQRVLHEQRIRAIAIDNTPEGHWLASWYYDSGATASGWHAQYGVAMCGSAGPCYPFGTRIKLFYGSRTVIAIVDDHGPYVGGRNIDLGENTARAIGFGGVGTVGFRIEH